MPCAATLFAWCSPPADIPVLSFGGDICKVLWHVKVANTGDGELGNFASRGTLSSPSDAGAVSPGRSLSTHRRVTSGGETRFHHPARHESLTRRLRRARSQLRLINYVLSSRCEGAMAAEFRHLLTPTSN